MKPFFLSFFGESESKPSGLFCLLYKKFSILLEKILISKFGILFTKLNKI